MKLPPAALHTIRHALVGFLMLSGIAWAQETDTPVFSLTSDDVPKVVILAGKPNTVILEVTYSKPKQEELLGMTREGLPKKIGFTLNGTPVSERTFTAPSTGHSLKFPVDSLTTAFAFTESLIPPAPASLADEAEPSGADAPPPTLTLSPDDVVRVTVFVFQSKLVFLDVSLSPAKRDQLASLVADHPDQAVRFVVNGSIIAEREVPPAAVSRTLRLDMPSLATAFSKTHFLMNAAAGDPR